MASLAGRTDRARRSLLVLLASSAMVAGCSNHSHSESADVDAGAGGDAGGAGGDAGVDAPIILSLTSTVSEITEGGSFTVIAVVTEPTGVANLLGGELTSGDGAVTYGAFVATTPGTYSLALSWDQVNTGLAINFVGSEPDAFRATFFNAAGNHTSQTVPVSLSCGSGGGSDGACSGTCTKLDTTADCGACNAQCPGASPADLTGLSAVSCAAPNTCAFSGDLASLAYPSNSCITECTAAAPSATCSAAQATMEDGSSQAIGCADSFTTYQPTTTAEIEGEIDCICQGEQFQKDFAGSCGSLCPINTCLSTTFRFHVGNTYTSVTDACTGPYLYADWDNLAVGVATVTVALRPTAVSCACEVPAQ